MKFNSNYILREIAGETLLVRQGVEGIDMTKVVALNASGAFLYNRFKDTEFNSEDAVKALMAEYDVDAETAKRDVQNWINSLIQYDAISS